MSFHIGDTVRIGKGKVDYVVAEEPSNVNDLGTYAVTVESMNTQRQQVVEAARLTLIGSAYTEPMNVPQEAVSAPESVIEDIAVSEGAEAFDPREDRRQSAYGLAVLNALVMKAAKRPGSVYFSAINPTSNKPIGSKRSKVRARIKARRTLANNVRAQYNTLRRERGYNIAS